MSVYLDIETTGLDAFADRIIMIGVSDGVEHRLFYNENEKELIESFLNYMFTNRDLLVTFNGDLFDLKFIVTRAIKYGLNPCNLLLARHVDYMWVVKKYFKTARGIPSLKELARFLDIEVEKSITGAQVVELWEKRDIAAIKKHLESDLMLLKKIHEKMKHICEFDLRKRYGEREEEYLNEL
jgi:uncharacterized protein YprB with RNaseH-like and TPR domain